jgi:hypothetical protein
LAADTPQFLEITDLSRVYHLAPFLKIEELINVMLNNNVTAIFSSQKEKNIKKRRERSVISID